MLYQICLKFFSLGFVFSITDGVETGVLINVVGVR